jgi:hypothetical protein
MVRVNRGGDNGDDTEEIITERQVLALLRFKYVDRNNDNKKFYDMDIFRKL